MINNILKNLVFLDTETTGIKKEDKIFQVAYILEDREESELFLPPLPISTEASEATHYTDADVKNKEKFSDSIFKTELKKILSNEDNILIAHNAKFDIKMLEKEDVQTINFIDTYKLAQFLDPKGQLRAYRLQYLRYALKLNTVGARAHDALGDVIVLKALFERLYKKISELYPEKERKDLLNEMVLISTQPILIKKFVFGKYIDLTVEDVSKKDKGYLEWLLKQKEKQASEGDVDEDWIYTLKKYLN